MVATRSLRFLLIAVLVVGLFASVGISPSVAQPAGSTTRSFHIEELSADFVIPTKKEGVYKWLGVHATRLTDNDTGAVELSGYPIRGTCEGDETGYNLPCNGRGIGGWRVKSFDADAAMNTGSVVMKKKGRQIKISFVGSTPFASATSAYENGCGGTTTDTHTLSRNATAEGSMWGRPVSTATESDGNRAAERMRITERTEECP